MQIKMNFQISTNMAQILQWLYSNCCSASTFARKPYFTLKNKLKCINNKTCKLNYLSNFNQCGSAVIAITTFASAIKPFQFHLYQPCLDL